MRVIGNIDISYENSPSLLQCGKFITMVVLRVKYALVVKLRIILMFSVCKLYVNYVPNSMFSAYLDILYCCLKLFVFNV